MSVSPIARLQSLSDEEKIKLSAILKRRLLFRALLFFGAVLVSLTTILYFNSYGGYKVEENLEIINVVFVVVIVLCVRLLFSEVMDYGKEMKSPNKKIIHAKIAGIKDGKIILGNKSFGKEEILLDSSHFDSLKGGDEVILEISAKSNTLFSVKKIVK